MKIFPFKAYKLSELGYGQNERIRNSKNMPEADMV